MTTGTESVDSRGLPRPLLASALPWLLVILAGVLLVAIPFSSNAGMWIVAVGALVAAVWLVGGAGTYPVLLWLIGMTWAPIVTDILNADLTGTSLDNDTLGSFRREAVLASLAGLMALAIGMRLSLSGVKRLADTASRRETQLDVRRVGLVFFLSYPVVAGLSLLAYSSPGLRQPVLAFVTVKFVLLYLLATTVLDSGRGYAWLIAAMIVELATGVTGFFSDYKEAFFILILALAGSRRKLSGRVIAAGSIAMIVMVWVSLVWTAIKPEYRAWVSGYSLTQTVARPFDERIEFITSRIVSNSIDYDVAYLKLLRRIGYTEVYAKMLARLDGGYGAGTSFYSAAVRHVLTPRILFPDKPELDDSAITTALTGQEIDPSTSIGVGYIAEAHADYGFPTMLLPIMLIGMLLGAMARYFMTRPAPLLVRQAFATGGLFSMFAYESNIDKSLGGLIVVFVALAIVLKFGYPLIAHWLGQAEPRQAAGEIPAQ